MAHKSLVPKQRPLTEDEDQTSFESWREGMIFHISLSDKSARFLPTGNLSTWTSAGDRGFTDDADGDPGVNAENKMNKQAKAALLNIILGSIAGYATVINGKYIKRQAKSLEEIWSKLRTHYGFRRTGSRVLELMDLKMGATESREALWERFYGFIEDQLLTSDGDVNHEGAKLEEDEVFTPTLLNIMVTCWLHTINPALPALIRQRFATTLRNTTVYTIREEVSEAIPTLLSELEERDCNINRTGTFQQARTGTFQQARTGTFQHARSNRGRGSFSNSKHTCCLCLAAGRPSNNHFLSSCPFLPAEDKRYISRSREVSIQEDQFVSDEGDDYNKDYDASIDEFQADPLKNRSIITPNQDLYEIQEVIPNVRRVDVFASPTIEVSIQPFVSEWTLDSGAEANCIRYDECKRLGLKIEPTSQRATQGDGKTPLPTYGEVHFTAYRGHHKLSFNGLVVKDLDTAVLAGMPFHRVNQVTIDYSQCCIILDNCCKLKFNPEKRLKNTSKSAALRVGQLTCILPGEEIKFELPESLRTETVSVEPRSTVPNDMPDWVRCDVVTPDAEGKIILKNHSKEPVLLSKHTQVIQVRPTVEMEPPTELPKAQSRLVPSIRYTNKSQDTVNIDLSASKVLTREDKSLLNDIHQEYKSVFSPGIGCYNGYSGKFSHTINIGPNLPPQRRGRIPNYSRGDKDLLQEKFDYLQKEGVFARAEDIGQPVEYVHPSFLIRKPSGGHRLVTSFGEVAEYARPQPTVNNNVEHVIQQIGQYDEIIIADISDAYYNIPLHPNSSKYVGVITPYTGTLVYQRTVMGLPGSEASLEELLSRIFGDLIKEGRMVKVADDLFLGSSTVKDLVETWREVLKRLQNNGLKLNKAKTKTRSDILRWEDP